jgi:hypothetical protein
MAVAALFGEQESTEQVNCIVSSMHQAGPLYPQLLTYRCGAANCTLRARNRQSWTAVMLPCCRTSWQVSLMTALGWDRFEEC